MRFSLRLAVFASLCYLLPLSCVPEPVDLMIMETTDLHGVLSTIAARISTDVNLERSQYGDRLILLDGGDYLNGGYNLFFANYIDTSCTHPYATYFNKVDYDAIGVGNHDMETGMAIINRFYKQCDMPPLCANVINKRNGKPFFKPYLLLRRDGYKIVVLGLSTEKALQGLYGEFKKRVEVVPMIESAKYWVERIQKRINPDLIVGLVHSGANDAQTRSLIEEVPGFHLLLCGHRHQYVQDYVVDKQGDTVWLMEPRTKGVVVAKARVHLEKGNKPIIRTEMDSTLKYPVDSSYLNAFESFMLKSRAYARNVICSVDTNLIVSDVLKGPSTWATLLHDAMDYTKEKYDLDSIGVDLTVATCFLNHQSIGAGTMVYPDFLRLIPFEDRLCIIEMRARDVKEFLEYNYSLIYDRPDDPMYYLDDVRGINYNVYPSRSKGTRVVLLRDNKTSRIYQDRLYHIMMTSYRANGGGNYLTEGLRWDHKEIRGKIIWESDKGFRDLMIEYVSAQKSLHPRPLPSWSVLRVY